MRYLRAEHYFDDMTGITSKTFWKDQARAETYINYYDNTIRYTDKVLYSILQEAMAASGKTLALYFSDHGQEVYDTRSIRGCDSRNPSRHMVEVPFILWSIGKKNHSCLQS